MVSLGFSAIAALLHVLAALAAAAGVAAAAGAAAPWRGEACEAKHHDKVSGSSLMRPELVHRRGRQRAEKNAEAAGIENASVGASYRIGPWSWKKFQLATLSSALLSLEEEGRDALHGTLVGYLTGLIFAMGGFVIVLGCLTRRGILFSASLPKNAGLSEDGQQSSKEHNQKHSQKDGVPCETNSLDAGPGVSAALGSKFWPSDSMDSGSQPGESAASSSTAMAAKGGEEPCAIDKVGSEMGQETSEVEQVRTSSTSSLRITMGGNMRQDEEIFRGANPELRKMMMKRHIKSRTLDLEDVVGEIGGLGDEHAAPQGEKLAPNRSI